MNKVSKLATLVLASIATGIAGIAAAVVLTTAGGTATADGYCPTDMHWLICPTSDPNAGTVVDDILW